METDTSIMLQFAEGMKYIGIGLVCLAMIAAAKGLSAIFTTIISSVSRNPEVKKDVTTFAFIGGAMVESIALIAFVLGLLMLVM